MESDYTLIERSCCLWKTASSANARKVTCWCYLFKLSLCPINEKRQFIFIDSVFPSFISLFFMFLSIFRRFFVWWKLYLNGWLCLMCLWAAERVDWTALCGKTGREICLIKFSKAIVCCSFPRWWKANFQAIFQTIWLNNKDQIMLRSLCKISLFFVSFS